MFVAAGVCLVCAVFVCFAAVTLKPLQDKNVVIDKQLNILQAAGLYREGIPVQQQFAKVITKVINLDTGEYVNDINSSTYNQLRASKSFDDKLSTSFSDLGIDDKIKIGRRENHAFVYIINNESDKNIEKIILPIRGYGLWSTLYGFIALEGDGQTVAGLGFYDQKETPGLGGEVDNPDWKKLWRGKKLFDKPIINGGKLAIEVIKGKVQSKSPRAIHQVDGLSGATITTKGVDNLIAFWLGTNGFLQYLERVQQQYYNLN